MDTFNIKALLTDLFLAGIGSVDTQKAVQANLPAKPKGKCIVVGAGKCAGPMALAVEAAWPDVDIRGAVVVPYGQSVQTRRIDILEAAHPIPDGKSLIAGHRMFELVRRAGPDDLVLALMSGGGSSLMSLPAGGISFDEKVAVNQLLLKSGLNISLVNRVRRRLSAIKGGRLAQALQAGRLVTLAISDIPGDAPEDIASGPTFPAPNTDEDIAQVIETIGKELPPRALQLLLQPCKSSPSIDTDFRIIATPRIALEAAAKAAKRAGIQPIILGDAIEGEAREVAKVMSGIAKSSVRHNLPQKPPAILLSGGETTVTIGAEKPGRGGRNTEFLLSLALALDGEPDIYAFSGDTDGIDGTENAAGAIASPDTLAKSKLLGLDAFEMLKRHDSYSFFGKLDDLIVTGPTLTNVNDLRGILVL